MKLIHYKILTIVLVVLLVGAVVWGIQQTGWKSINRISSNEAANKVLTYIDTNILKNQATTTLVGITEDRDKGLYKLNLKIGSQELESYVSFDGKTFYPEAFDLGTTSAPAVQKVSGGQEVDGGFLELANQEIYKENGKPVIYYFGLVTCPHCVWEHPIIKKVVAQFGDKIIFHDNMATTGNEMKDKDIFNKYSDGGVPTIVLAGRYYREGSGEEIGEQKETEVLTKLIGELLK